MLNFNASNQTTESMAMLNRPMRRPAKPVSFDEASNLVMTLCIPARTEVVPLSTARHRVLAADARASIDLPAFSRAMMDGFAIRADDVLGPYSRLKVVEKMAAGDPRMLRIRSGEAVRIATGAQLPDGADSVARFEWCHDDGDSEIRLIHPIVHGESVQPMGDDGKRGQTVVKAGIRLNGAQIAVCRSFGIRDVTVTARPTVSIIVTGGELVPDVNQYLESGQIYASSDSYLTDALDQDGCWVLSVDYVGDDMDAIIEAITTASRHADYVLITGGVSAGDFDYVPRALRSLDSDLVLERILMRPGAPFSGAKVNNATVFAMSGNPAACLIQFELFVRPVIRRSLGLEDKTFPASGKLRYPITLKPLKHVRLLRATAFIEDGEVWVDARMAQSSGVISGFATANCLIRLDEHDLAEGSVVPLRWLSGYPT